MPEQVWTFEHILRQLLPPRQPLFTVLVFFSENCLVFEDSLSGAEAAIKAGMNVSCLYT
jgi:hypothetical protein